MVTANLYLDADGKTKLGAYIHKKTNERYYAQVRFYPGYGKTKLFYDIEGAKAWIDSNYNDIKRGVYYDEIIGETVTLRYF